MNVSWVYILATLMAVIFVIWSEEDYLWRGLIVPAYSAMSMHRYGMPPLAPFLMECALIIILVLYCKVKGLWPGD